MWHKLSEEPLDCEGREKDTVRRWKHEDGRRAVHVTGNGPLQPELLVLDADGVVLREYDLPGEAAAPDPTEPLKGARLVRAVAATAADDITTPGPDDDDEAWALLRGWS